MSFTTGLLGDIVALGDSIRVLFGEIAENWPSKCKHNALYTCGGSSSNGQVAERAAGRHREENKDGTSPLGVAAQFGHLEVTK